jgi:ArsR family transcriptional regulator
MAWVDMLRHLIHFGPTPFYDFVRKYPLAPSTISQHFSILREAHLVNYTEIYPTTIYAIDQPTLDHALKLLGGFLTELLPHSKTGEVIISA